MGQTSDFYWKNDCAKNEKKWRVLGIKIKGEKRQPQTPKHLF